MQFNSLSFLLFFPLVLLVWRLLDGDFRNYFLLGASYFFYSFVHPWFAILLLATTCFDFFIGQQISLSATPPTRKKWLVLSVAINLGVLAVFKYGALFWNTGMELFGSTNNLIQNWVIPAGLSFYTFQSMSYTIDIYRNKQKPEKSLTNFALYVSFFPQLVAGPVERYGNLMPQLLQPKPLNEAVFFRSVRLIVWGFFKKIAIADRLADFVNPVFDAPETYQGLTLLVAGFFFVVQVYADFSGYTDIATGVARFFGVELQLNWKRPLLSTSLREFWTRNHISMTTWFRDYLYIGLGGSRCSRPRWLLNLFLTFIISGFWHGPAWTFVLWGAMHGVFYIIEILVVERFGALKRLRWAGWIYLLTFHTLSLIAFRAQSTHDLGVFYERIFSFDWHITRAFWELRYLNDLFPLALAGLMIALLFAKEAHEEFSPEKKSKVYITFLRPMFYVVLVLLLFTLGQFSANEFIYFHF